MTNQWVICIGGTTVKSLNITSPALLLSRQVLYKVCVIIVKELKNTSFELELDSVKGANTFISTVLYIDTNLYIKYYVLTNCTFDDIYYI